MCSRHGALSWRGRWGFDAMSILGDSRRVQPDAGGRCEDDGFRGIPKVDLLHSMDNHSTEFNRHTSAKFGQGTNGLSQRHTRYGDRAGFVA